MRATFESKLIGEDRIETFDFLSYLPAGDSILTAAVTCATLSGTDAAPQALVSGSATIGGTKVTQLIIDGLAGVVYTLTCEVTTMLGHTLSLMGYYVILPPNAAEAPVVPPIDWAPPWITNPLTILQEEPHNLSCFYDVIRVTVNGVEEVWVTWDHQTIDEYSAFTPNAPIQIDRFNYATQTYIGVIPTTLSTSYLQGGSVHVSYNGKLYILTNNRFAVVEDLDNPAAALTYSAGVVYPAWLVCIEDWTPGYVWTIQGFSSPPYQLARYNLTTLAFTDETLIFDERTDAPFYDDWVGGFKGGLMASDGNMYVVGYIYDTARAEDTAYIYKITSGLTVTRTLIPTDLYDSFGNPYVFYSGLIEADGGLWTKLSTPFQNTGIKAVADVGRLVRYDLTTEAVTQYEVPPPLYQPPQDFYYSSESRCIFMHYDRIYLDGTVQSVAAICAFSVDTNTVVWELDVPSWNPGYALYVDEDMRVWMNSSDIDAPHYYQLVGITIEPGTV